jgi:hypothetical protein
LPQIPKKRSDWRPTKIEIDISDSTRKEHFEQLESTSIKEDEEETVDKLKPTKTKEEMIN